MTTNRQLFEDAGSIKQPGEDPACQFRSDKPWLGRLYHTNGTIIKPDELENVMRDPPGHIDRDILDRIHGSMLGMAIGDAVGAFVEFRPHEYMVANPVTTMRGGGTWGLNKGQFTDDTSMGLCLANSLVTRQDYVPYDQLVRYKWWHLEGYMSSTGSCFDIGSATRQSLVEFERRQKEFAASHSIPFAQLDLLSNTELLDEFNVLCSKEGVAGNGALMRLAPVPLFFYLKPVAAVEYSGHSGKITHGDDKAYDACRYYGALIVAALYGEAKEKLLDDKFYLKHKKWFHGKPLHEDILKISEGSYKKGGYEKGIRGKGYIVSALEAALWAFWSDDNSFEKGVLAAVNLGDDTDTTAAIYGQLAGAHYGFRKLPEKWVEKMYAKRFIECLSKWIVYEGGRWALKEPTTPSIPTMTVESPSKFGSASPFEQEANSSAQSQPIENQERESILLGNNQTAQMGPTLESRQFDDPESAYRPRRYTVHDKTFTLQPNPHGQHVTNRPGSAGRRNPTSISERVYIHSDLKSIKDVRRLIRALGDDYVAYAESFNADIIDGYWLLNHVDEKQLKKLGVENKDHRQVILNVIEQLKTECPEQYVIGKK